MSIKNRQYIPTMSVKPTIWQRVRGAAAVAVAAVRSVGVRVVAFVVRKTTRARIALFRAVHVVMVCRPWVLTRDGAQDAVSRVAGLCRITWQRVIYPFMRVRVVVLGIGIVVVGLVVAPVTTLLIIAMCGVSLIMLSRLIRFLEETANEVVLASVALRVIEIAAQVLRVAAYVAAGAVVLVISAVSAVFAVTEVLELVLRYLDVPLAASLAALAFFVLTANWGLGMVEIAWLVLVHEEKTPTRVTRSYSQDRQAIPLIRVDAERAWNGDETSAEVETHVESRLTKCMGCDLDDSSPRFGLGNMTSLCGNCFQYLVDDELVSAAERGEVSAEDVAAAVRAGIQVPAYAVVASGARLRSTRIDLDGEAITCRTEARLLSVQDSSRVHWAETGWWFDGRGERRARRWHGFVSGLVVASVEYEYQKDARGFYVSVEGGTWVSRAYKTLAGAQEAAADEISDRSRVAPTGIASPDMLPSHMRGYAQDGSS